MIDNILLITGTLHQRTIAELISKLYKVRLCAFSIFETLFYSNSYDNK